MVILVAFSICAILVRALSWDCRSASSELPVLDPGTSGMIPVAPDGEGVAEVTVGVSVTVLSLYPWASPISASVRALRWSVGATGTDIESQLLG